MTGAVRVVDLELTGPCASLDGLHAYVGVRALVRLHGSPIGTVDVPVVGGRYTASETFDVAVQALLWPIIRHLLGNTLRAHHPRQGWLLENLLDQKPPSHPVLDGPLVTVAVCTRDRPAHLARCLDALLTLNYPRLDLLVVDNAPATDETEHLVRGAYPRVRYARESRPGLDWARNCAIASARGTIIAFTDDDVVVDTAWITMVVRAFADPAVATVTGLIVPLELDTPAQRLFEQYGGFGKGFRRRWFRLDQPRSERPVSPLAAGQFGAGANMSFRRDLFDRIGHFDPALDVGTPTNGGGDLEMLFRVLKTGHTVIYEPNALVRHCHRRNAEELRTQIANNGIAFTSFLVRTFQAYPDERARSSGSGCGGSGGGRCVA